MRACLHARPPASLRREIDACLQASVGPMTSSRWFDDVIGWFKATNVFLVLYCLLFSACFFFKLTASSLGCTLMRHNYFPVLRSDCLVFFFIKSGSQR